MASNARANSRTREMAALGIASRRYQGTGSLSRASFIPGQMCSLPSHTRGRSPVPDLGSLGLDLSPENWTGLNEKNPVGLAVGQPKGFADEAIAVQRAADRLYPAPAEEGVSVEEVCRKAGISIQTYYRWRKKYGGLMPSEMKRLKLLEEENIRLKKLVADLSLDKAMLQDVVKRKL